MQQNRETLEFLGCYYSNWGIIRLEDINKRQLIGYQNIRKSYTSLLYLQSKPESSMNSLTKSKSKQNLILFFIGMIGVLSSIPMIPLLLDLAPEPPEIPMILVQIISVIQSGVLLLLMVFLGSYFSHRVNLSAPVIESIFQSDNMLEKFKNIFPAAMFGGLIGGVFLLIFLSVVSKYLPSEFLEGVENFSPPWYTRLLYGGITEEILIRWGLMSFFTWCCYRITQSKGSEVRSINYIFAIVLSALIFGAGHLPVVFMMSGVVTVPLIAYIILGNAFFGLIAGYLYWKRGLECAIGAHMIAHITMLVGESYTRMN